MVMVMVMSMVTTTQLQLQIYMNDETMQLFTKMTRILDIHDRGQPSQQVFGMISQ
jgi:hypothetical protein